ncbi:MAG TPA: TetR/AcrR family transcriptional regulator [Candidatus Dormibacteraeota bacterium]|nr:TetR/AcrR family transcriptional regulator [Candidatus Dormibacteraeota bacterium]
MSPRPYQLGKRQSQIDQSRRRIVDAALAQLADSSSYTTFTVESVARRAEVARATIYYQFESKTGLLEALCDALAEAGQLSELGVAFANPEPLGALRAFVAGFGRFWAVDRLAMRRLRALGALDPEVGVVIGARDARRRAGLEVLVGRLEGTERAPAMREKVIQLLYALTSFETFDSLAGPDQSLTAAVDDVFRLASLALGLLPR